ALTGVHLVDPVADVRVLERAPMHGVEVDLAGEPAFDEDPEPVAGAELTLALSRAAADGERLTVDGRVGRAGDAHRLPLEQPVAVALTHLTPLHEVAAHERAQHHPPTEQADHRGRQSSSAPSSNVTLRTRAVWPMQPMRQTLPAYAPSP